MKSIKPGRGPSMMGGIMGIAVAIFGVFWTITAATMGAIPFVGFGVVFIVIAVVQVVYNFKNATSKNRYSAFDITTGDEEPDPLNERFGEKIDTPDVKSSFCPYCGNRVEEEYEYCNSCGKKLP